MSQIRIPEIIIPLTPITLGIAGISIIGFILWLTRPSKKSFNYIRAKGIDDKNNMIDNSIRSEAQKPEITNYLVFDTLRVQWYGKPEYFLGIIGKW
jgi:hypothetical protein